MTICFSLSLSEEFTALNCFLFLYANQFTFYECIFCSDVAFPQALVLCLSKLS